MLIEHLKQSLAMVAKGDVDGGLRELEGRLKQALDASDNFAISTFALNAAVINQKFKGDLTRAISLCEIAVAHRPDYPEGFLLLAELYFCTQEGEKATAALSRCRQLCYINNQLEKLLDIEALEYRFGKGHS